MLSLTCLAGCLAAFTRVAALCFYLLYLHFYIWLLLEELLLLYNSNSLQVKSLEHSSQLCFIRLDEKILRAPSLYSTLLWRSEVCEYFCSCRLSPAACHRSSLTAPSPPQTCLLPGQALDQPEPGWNLAQPRGHPRALLWLSG